MKHKHLILAMISGLAISGGAQATLIDRGSGLIYDDVLNITWLQDANYAKTSGYDADGRMNWANANAWAASLSYGGYDDWRLPTLTPIGANFNYNFSNNGSTDEGYNITSPHSEMAYMYYVNQWPTWASARRMAAAVPCPALCRKVMAWSMVPR
ncbi:MAG: DUF1566 domain-containing protein [Dechloromonas sp.]|uniref:DUF1566 domain-containing protein n=1 Tax=Candidatus Dechloromonas phosphorivorans TaxID=2899244 RepID=A0A935MVA9_9RHOO|nr:DUF1566 domain-containing protein [Candidatus Dechloromonas phosphorivorans]